MSADKDSLQKSLEWKEQEMSKVKDVHKETVSRFQGQLKDMRQKLEEVETRSALQVAEAKQQVHAAIEGKDAELTSLHSTVTSLKKENGELGVKIRELEKKCKVFLAKDLDFLKFCFSFSGFSCGSSGEVA